MCILVAVPRVNIYLDRDLHTQVTALRLNVSKVCQLALRAEVLRAKQSNRLAGTIRRAAKTQPNRRRQT